MLRSLNFKVDEKYQKIFVSYEDSFYAKNFWFSREDVIDILEIALESISHWCRVIYFDEDAYKLHTVVQNNCYNCKSFFDTFLQYGKLNIEDCDHETHVLTIEHFFDAIEKCGKMHCLPLEYFSNERYGRIDVFNIDSELADLVFQTALYGKLVYS